MRGLIPPLGHIYKKKILFQLVSIVICYSFNLTSTFRRLNAMVACQNTADCTTLSHRDYIPKPAATVKPADCVLYFKTTTARNVKR